MLQSDDRDEVAIQHVPILGADGTVRYRREALVDDGTLSDAHRHALAAFQQTLADPALGTRHQLRPGEVLVVDNHRALHGRTPIADERPRLLRRMKILA